MVNKPELERRYTTTSGRLVAEFRLPRRKLVILEPHDDEVVLGWSLKNVQDIAENLGRVASVATSVELAYDDDLTPFGRPNELAQVIMRLTHDYGINLQLVRIHGERASIIWTEDGCPAGGEVSVAAATWEEAGEFAAELDAADIAEALPELVSQLNA